MTFASTSKISASSSSSQMASPTKISTTTISKVLEGKVVSRANEKTAIVLIERKVPHPRFIKRINKSKRFAVHDEENESSVRRRRGDSDVYAKVKDQEVRVESHHEESLRRGLNTRAHFERKEREERPSTPVRCIQLKGRRFKIVGSRAL